MKGFIYIFSVIVLLLNSLSAKSQDFNVLLGRPTDTSITVSVQFKNNVSFYIKYGLNQRVYKDSTIVYNNLANRPDEIDLGGLIPNSRYYYIIKYKNIGSNNYLQSTEYKFHTQRAKGSSFRFTLESDEHLYDKKGIKSLYEICLANQAKDNPDFMLSLGDIFGDDHNPFDITSQELDDLHSAYRPLLGQICHSVPFYVCLGNHEGENDYYLGFTPPNNLAIQGTLWRKYYYPNPSPNAFYSGNTEFEPYGVGYPENYYAWEWGDALFVVLDVYRNENDSSDKPKNWDWSLGLPQYTWLKNTLESSSSKYKFVFAHHVRGQGRGGITNARLFEWGGYEQNGSNYTFDQKRPGWGKPIHQLFKDNGVNIFFQGHDHVFAHEVMDGITYQALPMPSDTSYMIGKLANADAYTSDTLDGSGHIRVEVNSDCIQVDYIKAFLPKDTLINGNKNGSIAFSYQIGNCKPIGFIDENQPEDLQVYPNPAYDKIYVKGNIKNEIKSLELFDFNGRKILQTEDDYLNINGLSEGFYLVKITSGSFFQFKKIIVRK